MNLIIKRQRFNAYHETNIICNDKGKELMRESNVAKSVKFGAKKIKYKGKDCTVIKWIRVSSKD